MGEKQVRGGKEATSIAKQKARIVLPLCVLLVLFVWNSPTLAPFDGGYSSSSDSGPPSVIDIGEAQGKALTSSIQYEVTTLLLMLFNRSHYHPATRETVTVL